MTRDATEVAKRLVLYADAITAFAVFQSVSFAFALANGHDFVDTLFKRTWIIILVLVTTICAYILYAFLVHRCHWHERAIVRTCDETTRKDKPVDKCNAAEKAAMSICYTRFVVIALAGILSITSIALTWYGKVHP